MINKKIVFILGAGASIPFGYPSGTELRSKILEILDPQTKLKNENQILKEIGFDRRLVLDFKERFTFSGNYSIDEFLKNNKDVYEIGKALICLSLIPLEKPETLFMNPETNWYMYLFDKMKTEAADDIANNEISIITFNYDRSLETFLFLALKNHYNINGKKAGEILRKLKIIHIHGQLGFHPYQEDDAIDYFKQYPCMENPNYLGKNPNIGFTSKTLSYYRDYYPFISDAVIKSSLKEISIIHDEENKNTLIEAQDLINNAFMTFFLGFGYHDINLNRLDIGKRGCKFYRGTMYKLSLLEKNAIFKKLGRGNNIQFIESTFANKTIFEYLREDMSYIHY